MGLGQCHQAPRQSEGGSWVRMPGPGGREAGRGGRRWVEAAPAASCGRLGGGFVPGQGCGVDGTRRARVQRKCCHHPRLTDGTRGVPALQRRLPFSKVFARPNPLSWAPGTLGWVRARAGWGWRVFQEAPCHVRTPAPSRGYCPSSRVSPSLAREPRGGQSARARRVPSRLPVAGDRLPCEVLGGPQGRWVVSES